MGVWSKNGVAHTSQKFWTAEGIRIDGRLEAAIGSGRVYADKQLAVTRTINPDGLRFSGEIDAVNRDAVAKCLSMTFVADDDIHLDVSGLIFCDVGGIRSFVDAAEHREKGRLMLHGLPELLQTVIRVTGWADLPNLVICNCTAGGA